MDAPGQDRQWDTSKGKASQRVKVRRSKGKEKKIFISNAKPEKRHYLTSSDLHSGKKIQNDAENVV